MSDRIGIIDLQQLDLKRRDFHVKPERVHQRYGVGGGVAVERNAGIEGAHFGFRLNHNIVPSPLTVLRAQTYKAGPTRISVPGAAPKRRRRGRQQQRCGEAERLGRRRALDRWRE